ncbi:MAG: hypothetical protein KGL02_05605 [Acidobacteriota bacterium]|nr:hypothetical protein [Acidobacteriota bacterium]
MAGIVFVDCEASSLRSGSFITESGCAVVEERRVHTGACLIRPLAKWSRVSNGWDPASARLTGISRDLLEREGISPFNAATRFLNDVGDRLLFSDEPAFDQFWVEQLFEAGDVDLGGWKLGDAKKLIAEAAARHQDPKETLAEAEKAASAQVTTRHRAEPDARRTALVYLWLLDHAL